MLSIKDYMQENHTSFFISVPDDDGDDGTEFLELLYFLSESSKTSLNSRFVHVPELKMF